MSKICRYIEADQICFIPFMPNAVVLPHQGKSKLYIYIYIYRVVYSPWHELIWIISKTSLYESK